MSLSKTWTAGLDKYKSDELGKKLLEAEDVLKRLENILQKKLDSAYNDQISNSNYENASWAHKQADSVGYQRALREVMNLLSKRN